MVLLNDFTTTVVKALDEIDPNWRSYNGLIVCGSHTPQNVEEMIDAIRIARETNTPFLGICSGHQLAAIEYARDVLGIKDATSEEFGIGTLVVKKRPELKVGMHNGELYWNNYEVAIEVENPPNFITCQYHPEYLSTKKNPHPLLVEFLALCRTAA